ncbi:hypothetical protein MesoLj131a_68060 (plasmid) [Mesorhizobium sp. 131-2-1]|nr:hypothetical protein MesoLj131a_68060 [Mesorhizobium sp. 131-2-1]
MVSQQSVEADPDLALDVFIVAIAIMPMPPVGWWSWYASATICWRSTAHVPTAAHRWRAES